MKASFFKLKKSYYAICFLMALTGAGSFLCLSFNVPIKNNLTSVEPDTGYAGSQTCMNCHKDIYASHIKTAHYLTSGIATTESIKGSFKPDKNVFVYNKFMKVVMEAKDGNFFQSAYIGNSEYQSEQFGIAIGSARKGQTFLYWQGNKLFQLPVSYYSPLNSWCNSPGLSMAVVDFGRPITARCLECHSTYAKANLQSDNSTVFEKSSIIYGIDCERCHGPAANHVNYHTAHPKDTIAKFIINARRLARTQRLDACALCHSGVRKEIKPVFSFTVGDNLSDYSTPNYNTDSSSWLDVHGNQYGLLTASKCFKMSNMDCSSCHNVHKEEINEPEVFSSRCMNCHNQASHNFCTLTSLPASTLIKNCIDCHMPRLPSKKIFLQMTDEKQSTPDLVRTHRIAIYPDQTKAFIERLQK
jgi:hypothetical protein